MKRILKITAWTVGTIVFLVVCFAATVQLRGIPKATPSKVELTVEVTSERVAKGEKLASIVCNKCHTSEEEHKLSGKYLQEIPAIFGKIYSKNITNDPVKGIGKWTDGEIYAFLRTGVRADGTRAALMPNYPLVADEDLYAIIAYLRSDREVVQASKREPPNCETTLFTKFLAQYIMLPSKLPSSPIPLPDTLDKVAHGKYLVDAMLDCFSCHSADFTKNNALEPEKSVGYLGGGNTLMDMDGKEIYSANLTMDKETGLGKWTEEQFITALKTGQTPNGPFRYPMEPYTILDDTEMKAIWAYLKTVPVIHNPVDRQRDGQK